MTRRYLASVIALGSALVVMSLAPAAGQAPSPPSKTAAKPDSTAKVWTQPKTPWGDPDIQGLWPATDMINVPMQRPANFGTRAVLTEEEYAQREAQAKRTAAADKVEYLPPGSGFGI